MNQIRDIIVPFATVSLTNSVSVSSWYSINLHFTWVLLFATLASIVITKVTASFSSVALTYIFRPEITTSFVPQKLLLTQSLSSL